MSRVAGIELVYAIIKAAVWGTSVACGAGQGFLALPSSIKRDAPIDVDDSLGQVFSQDGTPGEVTVIGDIPMYLRYDGLDLFLALFAGVAGVPSLHAAGAISYDYVYDLADNTDGLFATFARNLKNYVSEVPSIKIVGITIKGEVGKPLQLIVKTIGDNMVEDGTNDATSFNNVTIAEVSNRINFAQGVIRMNDKSAIALDAGDQIYPSSFELTAERNLEGVYGTRNTGGSNPQDLIDEPTNNDQPVVSLKLQFPQHTSKTYLTDLGADTRKKMDITFTGGLIEGAIPRLFALQLPHMQLKSNDVVDEKGIIKEPLEFICHGTDSAPAGMIGITKPVRISGTNQLSTDPLA